MRGVTSNQAAAVVRASRAWRECAVYMRGALRQRAVRGSLRPLDEMVAGRRGRAVPQGIALFVHNLHAMGMTPDEIATALQSGLTQVIDAALPQQSA